MTSAELRIAIAKLQRRWSAGDHVATMDFIRLLKEAEAAIEALEHVSRSQTQ